LTPREIIRREDAEADARNHRNRQLNRFGFHRFT
jgi:hypothetical protein